MYAYMHTSTYEAIAFMTRYYCCKLPLTLADQHFFFSLSFLSFLLLIELHCMRTMDECVCVCSYYKLSLLLSSVYTLERAEGAAAIYGE